MRERDSLTWETTILKDVKSTDSGPLLRDHPLLCAHFCLAATGSHQRRTTVRTGNPLQHSIQYIIQTYWLQSPFPSLNPYHNHIFFACRLLLVDVVLVTFVVWNTGVCVCLFDLAVHNLMEASDVFHAHYTHCMVNRNKTLSYSFQSVTTVLTLVLQNNQQLIQSNCYTGLLCTSQKQPPPPRGGGGFLLFVAT